MVKFGETWWNLWFFLALKQVKHWVRRWEPAAWPCAGERPWSCQEGPAYGGTLKILGKFIWSSMKKHMKYMMKYLKFRDLDFQMVNLEIFWDFKLGTQGISWTFCVMRVIGTYSVQRFSTAEVSRRCLLLVPFERFNRIHWIHWSLKAQRKHRFGKTFPGPKRFQTSLTIEETNWRFSLFHIWINLNLIHIHPPFFSNLIMLSFDLGLSDIYIYTHIYIYIHKIAIELFW